MGAAVSNARVRRVSPLFHLVALIEGTFRYRIADGPERRLSPGSGLLLVPGLVHDLVWSEASFGWIDWTWSIGAGLSVEHRYRFPVLIAEATCERILAAVQGLSRISATSSDPRDQGESLVALATIQAALLAMAEPRPPDHAVGRLAPALEAVAAAPQDQWPRARLCRLTGLSPIALTNAFRSVTGLSPARHVARARLILAQELLISCDDPLERIASRCGFADAYHLGRRFKFAFGEAPGTYRRSRRSAAPIPGHPGRQS